MAIVTIEIPDDVLADFYKSIGASPDPTWSPEDAVLWLQIEHFEPFVHTQIIQQVKQFRINEAVAEANRQARADASKLDQDIEARRQARRAALPERMRPGAVVPATPEGVSPNPARRNRIVP